MRMNNKTLVKRLTDLGWQAEYGYQYTWVQHPDGRTGRIPFASKDTRGNFFSTAEWDRLKRDLRLQGEEIYGR